MENGEFRGEDQWTESQTSVKMQKNKSTGEAQSLELKEKRKCEGDWKIQAWEAGEAAGKYHETETEIQMKDVRRKKGGLKPISMSLWLKKKKKDLYA